jgi:hypothetical protein
MPVAISVRVYAVVYLQFCGSLEANEASPIFARLCFQRWRIYTRTPV